MACKQCAKNRQRSLERRREILQKRQERLTEACEQGDQLACRTLAELQAAQQYRQQHRYQHEHHRRAATDP